MVEEFKLDSVGLAKPLRDGDVVTLLAISPQFANAVTLKGHVAQPLRYPYTPGMRIRDLIPDKDALISPDFYRRKNLLVQVIDDEDDDNVRQRSRRNADRDTAADGADRVAPMDRRDSATRERNDRVTPSDRTESRSARRPRRSAERDEDRSPVAGAKRAPTTLFDELNWDYAVIERLNEKDLSTQVIPFNLGLAVLRGDPANNVELLPGDVVTVYSQKDVRVPIARQTRLVSLDGEVAAPGVYQLLPGETLRSLLTRAGGLTAQAYVYGLEFSREETRQKQRENLASAIARLEALSATQAAREAANRRDDASAAQNTAVSNCRDCNRTAASPSSSAPRHARSRPCPMCRWKTPTAFRCRRGPASSRSRVQSSTTTRSCGSPAAPPATTSSSRASRNRPTRRICSSCAPTAQ